MIADARRKASYQVNATMIDLYWGIGEFVSNKAVQDGWGRSCPKTKSDAERLFYLKLASREKYKAKENFKPEYLGKMQFYLEALDRDVKKSHENPSVGIIFCKSKDEDVVEYALSRNMSPTMISEYRTKLISKEILQKKLEELTEMVDEDKNSQWR